MRLKRIAKFTASVTKGLLPSQQATLSQMVCGLLVCRSLILAEIARGLQTQVAFPHNLKRVGSGIALRRCPRQVWQQQQRCRDNQR